MLLEDVEKERERRHCQRTHPSEELEAEQDTAEEKDEQRQIKKRGRSMQRQEEQERTRTTMRKETIQRKDADIKEKGEKK